MPRARGNSRDFTQDVSSTRLNLKDICERVNQTEALELINMLTAKYNLLIPSAANPEIKSQITTPTKAEEPAQKKRIVVVRKKPAEITEPVLSPAPVSKTKTEGIPLSDFLLNFWDFEKSEFIKRYIAHGHNMTKRHTDNMLSLVRNYWQAYFGDEITVQELDRATLDDFFYLNT
ncbi:hypothetical protein [Treponema sp. Marseille-Q3903]|uniref:hypothetical protein n=1 Tax=Treponema sp. Marseille-Q3903 TaxID=2766703 RepID=UPI001651CBB9|nr:hypothetical protein [Treponema sp. Marseille-Q3903]MBC6714264.1 hypothetical protein [Treponema sp. Marseille-Q3903]